MLKIAIEMPMRKTPEEMDAIMEELGDAAIRSLNENVARDKPKIDKIIADLERKHALKMKAAESSKTTEKEES